MLGVITAKGQVNVDHTTIVGYAHRSQLVIVGGAYARVVVYGGNVFSDGLEAVCPGDV